jgi:hypothetical protein
MNKKGFFDLVDIFAFIFLCLLFTVFYIYFLYGGNLQKSFVQDEVKVLQYKDLNTLLLNYLRTPTENDKTISDLLIESYIKNDYKDFENKTREILDKSYDKNFCFMWNIDITLIPDNKNVFEILNKKVLMRSPTGDVSIYLPIYNDKTHFLKVRLYEYC